MNSTHRIFRATSDRPTSLAGCAVLAVALNAGAIGLAATASSAWRGVAISRSNTTPLKTMTLVSTHDQPTVEAGNLSVASGGAISIAPTPKLTKLPAAHTTPVSSSSPPPQPVVFYAFHEVDNPAFPESDWNLDVESLDAVGVQRLAFEVLISNRGDVVGCTVLAPTDLADDVKRGLEERLSATRLLPAEREGQLVASVRRIELAVAVAPPDVPPAPAVHRP